MLTPEDRQDAADAKLAARKGRAYAEGAWDGEEPWETVAAEAHRTAVFEMHPDDPF
jgi:hypothetical protein